MPTSKSLERTLYSITYTHVLLNKITAYEHAKRRLECWIYCTLSSGNKTAIAISRFRGQQYTIFNTLKDFNTKKLTQSVKYTTCCKWVFFGKDTNNVSTKWNLYHTHWRINNNSSNDISDILTEIRRNALINLQESTSTSAPSVSGKCVSTSSCLYLLYDCLSPASLQDVDV